MYTVDSCSIYNSVMKGRNPAGNPYIRVMLNTDELLVKPV
jgi:hypothetical protein